MELLTSDIAKATGGALSGADVEVAGATIDSRQVVAGQLFVPVVASRDGHDFVAAAVAEGAAAYLTSARSIEGADAAAVEVGDTVEALADAGRHARTRLPERVVGITGSVGKTSVKDLLAVALAVRWRTSASAGSFNNELGVPLTLVNAADDTEALVVEMGARGVGHIAELSALASPTVGVVTRVAAVHTEMFGTLEEVAAAKGELVEALPAGGYAILNAGDALVAAMASAPGGNRHVRRRRRGSRRVAGSGRRAPAVVPRRRPGASAPVRLPVRGEHMIDNALAAAAAARCAGSHRRHRGGARRRGAVVLAHGPGPPSVRRAPS